MMHFYTKAEESELMWVIPVSQFLIILASSVGETCGEHGLLVSSMPFPAPLQLKTTSYWMQMPSISYGGNNTIACLWSISIPSVLRFL